MNRKGAFDSSSLPIRPKDRIRLVILALGVCALFCLLIVRFYQIQIIQGEKWTKFALSQHCAVLVEPFQRGSFYSNSSLRPGHPEEPQLLVMDVPKFHLFIDPSSIPKKNREKMAAELFDLLGFFKEKREKIAREFERKSRSRKICTWLNREEKEKILSWWTDFSKKEGIVRNALFFSSDYKRSYPFGSLLGAILHTVQDEKDAHTAQSLPTGGLEMVFNRYLKGKLGKRLITRSPRHPLDSGVMLEEPENGADIYLTINHHLQAIAEAELAKGVQAAKARGGWAVMMDPYTGEILSLAQNPPFDPTRYPQYFNNPEMQEHTRVKAVSDCFEPGSIFKPITLAICLQASEELRKAGKAPLFTSDEKIPTANGWFPGRSTPLKDGRCHSFLNMDLALQKSSNIYMGRIAQRLVDRIGIYWYREALEKLFGFGKKTQIELPAENPGLVPMPGKLHPNGKLEWSLPTPYSLAIGHNILVNSIQIVRAYGIIANGGYFVEPHLIRKIARKQKEGAKEVLFERKEIPLRRVLSPSVVKSLVRAMKFATKEGGTSKRADIHGYTEAGKSGTSEKIINGVYSKEHHVSSFLGFAPAKQPRFVLLVSIDDPEKKLIPGVGRQQHGGVCAAPVFREIATQSLKYLGVEPDDPYGYPPGDPRRDVQRADWTDEIRKLKELYQTWSQGLP